MVAKDDDGGHRVTVFSEIQRKTFACLRTVEYRRILQQYFEHWHIYDQLVLPRGSSVAATINIMAVTIGVGTLSMPYAASKSGAILFVFLNTITFALMVWSVYIMARLVEVTQMPSFELITRKVLRSHRFEVLVEILIVIGCFGTGTAYMVILGDVAEQLSNLLSMCISKSLFRFCAQVFFFFVCFLPLSLPKTIGALQYVSSFGIGAIALLVIFVVVEGFSSGTMLNVSESYHHDITITSIFVSLPLMFFAYGSQINCVEIYSELHERSPRGFVGMLLLGVGIVFACYVAVGLFGLSALGNTVSGDALQSYSTTNPLADVAMLGVGIKAMLSFPFMILPCREAILHLMGFHTIQDVSSRTHVAATVAIASSALIVAVFVPTVVTLFGVIGAVCSSIFGFILPGLLALLEPNYKVGLSVAELQFHRIVNIILICVGVAVGAIGFWVSLEAAMT